MPGVFVREEERGHRESGQEINKSLKERKEQLKETIQTV